MVEVGPWDDAGFGASTGSHLLQVITGVANLGV